MTVNRVLAFLVALVFLAIAAEAVKSGRARVGMSGNLFGPSTFRRESRPIGFWLAVFSYLVVAVLLGVIALGDLK
jgi:hypothetical protein